MAYLEKIEALNNYKEEGKIPFLTYGTNNKRKKKTITIFFNINIY